MAYGFNGTDQYLGVNSTPVTSTPITLYGIFNSNAGNNGVVLAVGSSGSGTHRWQIAYNSSTVYTVLAQAFDASSSSAISSNSQFSDGVFNYLSGVFGSSTSREVFLNGTSRATASANIQPSGVNSIYIGARNSNGIAAYASGSLAEAAIWNVALTAAECASLGKGFKPYRIRPQSLVFYAPLVRNLQDTKGALTITNNNTATVAAHPRVI